jgi:hypothetical protein
MGIARETAFRGHALEVSQELKKSAFGVHFLVIYPDLLTLREMYSYYVKSSLSGLQNGLMPFVEQTVGYAKKLGKSGLSVLADMGSFFYNDKKDDLLQYEIALPFKYKNMNLKGFCVYHKLEL